MKKNARLEERRKTISEETKTKVDAMFNKADVLWELTEADSRRMLLQDSVTTRQHNGISYRMFREDIVFKAMDLYAELVTDRALDIYRKPLEELKPLEDMWREENPRDEYTIPDLTNLLKWVVQKIKNGK